jgi:alkylation response protein AidB-like acyl-CoA dehydrogenase
MSGGRPPQAPASDIETAQGQDTVIDQLLDELCAFLDAEIPRHRNAWGSQADAWPGRLDWQRRMAAAGWAAPAWDAQHGGRNADVSALLAIEAASAARGMPLLPGMLGLKNVGPTIAVWGTPEQKEHLARILTADEIWSQGFSEPEAGSDLASLRTTAVLDGDDFVINGQKIWTSHGHYATHMELLARTDPTAPKHKGISVLLVDLTVPGIEVRPIRQINGDTDFAEVFFTDVRVPRTALLGPLNHGWTVTRTTLGHERSGAAIFTVRLAEDVRTLIAANAAERRGEPLAAGPRDDLIKRYVETRVLDMLSRRMITKLAAGEQPGAAQSVIKLVFSETRQRVADTIFELDGIDSVVTECSPGSRSGRSIAHEYLSARSATIAAGTSQIVRTILAERVLGLPRQ